MRALRLLLRRDHALRVAPGRVHPGARASRVEPAIALRAE